MSVHFRQREVERVQRSQQPAAPHLAPELALLVAVAVTAAPHTPQFTLADTQQHEHSSEEISRDLTGTSELLKTDRRCQPVTDVAETLVTEELINSQGSFNGTITRTE